MRHRTALRGKYQEHKFVLTEETHRKLLRGRERPPQPLVRVETLHTVNVGFTFGKDGWGLSDDAVLVAQFGTVVVVGLRYELPGSRVVKLNLRTGASEDFLVNQSGTTAYATPGGGGLNRPIGPVFGPNGALYVVDFGIIDITPKGMSAQPGTGFIWKVTRR